MTKIVTFADGFSSATIPTIESDPTKANITLNNLSSTAVNADIIPADSSKNLGSSAKKWLEVFAEKITSTAALVLNGTYVDANNTEIKNLATPTAGTSGANKDYVDNRVANPANITQSASYRFVTDTEKSTWNGKEPAITGGTTSQYWRGDKTFQTLDKAAVGLGNVVNLDTSNPANITQSASYRFVTDAEKAAWNAVSTYKDTYANLVTWASTASDSSFGFSTDTKILYYVVSGVLQEIDVMRTISGTITTAQITVGTSAVRATVSGSAPSANRKRLMITPSNITGNIYLGGSGVTSSTGKIIVGPDSLFIDWDSSDYYLISDTAGNTVSILEVV